MWDMYCDIKSGINFVIFLLMSYALYLDVSYDYNRNTWGTEFLIFMAVIALWNSITDLIRD